jgi:hypothetical protein
MPQTRDLGRTGFGIRQTRLLGPAIPPLREDRRRTVTGDESSPFDLGGQADNWRRCGRIEVRGGDPIGGGSSFGPRKRVGVRFRVGRSSGRVFTVVGRAKILPDGFMSNRHDYRVRWKI